MCAFQLATVPTLPFGLLPAQSNASCHLLPLHLCSRFSSSTVISVPLSTGRQEKENEIRCSENNEDSIVLGWKCVLVLQLHCANWKCACVLSGIPLTCQSSVPGSWRHLVSKKLSWDPLLSSLCSSCWEGKNEPSKSMVPPGQGCPSPPGISPLL